MEYTCPDCGRAMEQRIRSEVRPTDLFDDATVLLFRCPSTDHSALLVLNQFERRGTLDDETVDTTTISLSLPVLRFLRELADTCPKLDNGQCDCKWHNEAAAAAILEHQTQLTRKAGEPFTPEDETEKGIYHYGVSY